MGKIVSRIVLTGGPCAGKTDSLCRIEEYFEELGYKVIIVPEAATLMINGGIRPFGNFNMSIYNFQDSIIKMQLQNENFFEKVVQLYPEETKCIVVYDRGIIDGNAYIENNKFEELLRCNKIARDMLYNHYDMVIHLVTAANGAREFYTLENNNARKESVSEAIALDNRTMMVWSGHPNFNIVDNSTDYNTKLDRVLNLISYNIGSGLFVRRQSKYLVDISGFDFLSNVQKIYIEQSYLGSQDYEKRLRKKVMNGVVNYYFTIQKYDRYGQSKVYTNKKISEEEYYYLLNSESDVRSINKVRYVFVYEDEQYRLDIYEDGKCILEANEKCKLHLPKEIEVLKDITNDALYYNYYLAKNNDVKKLLPAIFYKKIL